MADGIKVHGTFHLVTKETQAAFDKIYTASEQLEKALNGLKNQPSFEDPDVSMPIAWSNSDGHRGPKVDNPLAIDFDLSVFAGDTYESSVWRFDLDEIVGEVITLHIRPDGSISSETQKDITGPLADALQTLVDELRALPVADQ